MDKDLKPIGYFKGYLSIPVPYSKIREYLPENFNPMCLNLPQWIKDSSDCVQVLTMAFGKLIWMNINKSELIEED